MNGWICLRTTCYDPQATVGTLVDQSFALELRDFQRLIGDSMLRLQTFGMVLFLTHATPTVAEIEVFDFVEVPWSIGIFEAELPPPFYSIKVEILSVNDAQPTIKLEVNGQPVETEAGLLDGVYDISIETAALAYSAPDMTPSKTVEWVSVLMAFGESYKVGSEPCSDARFSLEQDWVKIRIDTALRVTSELGSFQSMNQCEQ